MRKNQTETQKKYVTQLLFTALNILEPLILLLIIYAFWFHSPNYRDNMLWLLWFALPIFRLRMLAFNRLWTETPLTNILIGFVILTAFNFATAPFARANYLVLLSRPLLGIWIFLYLVEHARVFRHLKWLVIGTIGMGFVLALVSLTTTNWTLDKAGDLAFIINVIPRWDWRSINWPVQTFPPISAMLLGFNPNEVAGALAYVVPVMAAFALGNPHNNETPPREKSIWLAVRISAGIAFALSLLSLILGQSRFAIAGVLGAIIIVIFLLVENRRWKIITLGSMAVLIFLQAAILFNLFTPVDSTDPSVGLSSRDQRTISTRFELWDTAARMMFDYPLTGTGMSMFRTAVNQPEYQIQYYVDRQQTPPHAHNEWLQIGADLGVIGFLMFITMQIIVLWMLWKGWRNNQSYGRLVAVAVFAGLLAHGVYGLGDAVTLWDRFSFILWWLVGLTGAQYILIPQFTTDNTQITADEN